MKHAKVVKLSNSISSACLVKKNLTDEAFLCFVLVGFTSGERYCE